MKSKVKSITWKNKNISNYIIVLSILILFFTYLYYGYLISSKDISYFILIILSWGLLYIGLFMRFKNPYVDIFYYIKENRNFFYLPVLLFLISGVIGFIFSENLSFLEDFLRQILEKTNDLNGIEMVDFIFFNNLSVAFWGFILGIFFGLFPLFNIIANGAVLGFVFKMVYETSSILDFWRILPHGIFELPAIFLSLGIGLKLGVFGYKIVKEFFKEAVKNKVLLIVPILIGLFNIFTTAFTLYKGISSFNLPREVFIPYSILSGILFYFVIIFLISFYKVILLRDKKDSIYSKFYKEFVQMIGLFLFLIIPLLIAAAIIEGTLITLSI